MAKETESLLGEANEIVTNYVEKKLTKSVQKAEEIRHGDSCSCKACTLSAVQEVNTWIDFITDDPKLALAFKYGTAKTKFGLKILQGRKGKL